MKRILGRVALSLLSVSLLIVACQDDKKKTSTGDADGGDGNHGNSSGADEGGNGNSGGGTGGTIDPESDCDDNVDNDMDTFTDCLDFDCQGTVLCPKDVENTDELCSNTEDDDKDKAPKYAASANAIDCDDPSCNGHPDVTVCNEAVLGSCTGGADDDGDGYIDCDDRDCWGNALCDAEQEQGLVECAPGEGTDDDGDGSTDCDDFSCQATNPACTETVCTGGVDEDEDGSIDCEDFDCLYAAGANCPGFESTDEECSDGMDNAGDADDFVDCFDFSCRDNPNVTVCEGNDRSCSDGISNDGNNFVDCDDFVCRCCPGEGDACTFERSVSTCAPCAEN